MISRRLILCASLVAFAACSEAGSSDPDARNVATVDAPVNVIDAAAGSPDATLGSPDATVAVVDGAVPDGAVPDGAVPDAMVPDAMVPDANTGCTSLPTTGTLTIPGETLGTDPVWVRPLAASGCPASGFSAVGTAAPYNTIVLCNDSGGPLTLDFAMDGSAEGAFSHTDPYLVLYTGTMIPADALQCLEGDDDGSPAGNGSLATGVVIAAGASVTVVPTGFDNTDIGTYQIRVVAP